jgi:hypothetical protein
MRIFGILALGPTYFVPFVTTLSLCLASCAQQPQTLWSKPGSAPDEFNQQRYACMQQSQQPNSSAYINRYGGVANSNIITNGGLFDACMNSQGWVLTPVTDAKAFSDAVRPIGEEMRGNCSREDLQALYRKKMACRAADATPEQLSDRSKISNDEKIALSKWRESVQGGNEKIAAIYRQFYLKNGDAVATVIEGGSAESGRLAQEFSNGGLSWGEYNKRRLELAKRVEANQKIALTY